MWAAQVATSRKAHAAARRPCAVAIVSLPSPSAMRRPVGLWSVQDGPGWLSSYRNTDASWSVPPSKGVRDRGIDPTVQQDMLGENVRRLCESAP